MIGLINEACLVVFAHWFARTYEEVEYLEAGHCDPSHHRWTGVRLRFTEQAKN